MLRPIINKNLAVLEHRLIQHWVQVWMQYFICNICGFSNVSRR